MQTQPVGEPIMVQQTGMTPNGQMMMGGQPQMMMGGQPQMMMGGQPMMMQPNGQMIMQPNGQMMMQSNGQMMMQPNGQMVMMQPMDQTSQVIVVQQQRPAVIINDDPTCLYIGAIVSLFIPLVGLILMCVYGCGSNLPPRQAVAFRVLVATTVTAIVVYIIISSTSG